MPSSKNQSLLEQARDQASEAVDAARPVIESAVATVVEQVRDLSKDAATGAKDLARDTATKAAPLIADGKVLAGELAEATREVAIPKAKSAAAAGAAGAVGLAASTKELAAAKVADIKGEPPKKKKGGKLRRLLFFGVLAAAAGFVYQKMRPKPDTDNWQSAYTPPPSAGSTSSTTSATTGTTAAAGGAHLAPGVGPDEPLAADDPMARLAAEGDDPGGADPAEAIADAVDAPHEVTTPDDPADVVEVDEEGANKT